MLHCDKGIFEEVKGLLSRWRPQRDGNETVIDAPLPIVEEVLCLPLSKHDREVRGLDGKWVLQPAADHRGRALPRSQEAADKESKPEEATDPPGKKT